MANEENLIPFNERTESEQRQIAQKGGIASGAARRRKRSMKEAADYYLSLPETDRRRVNALLRDEVDNEDIDNQMSVVMGITEAAKRGDARAAGVLLKMLGEETVQEDPAADALEAARKLLGGVSSQLLPPLERQDWGHPLRQDLSGLRCYHPQARLRGPGRGPLRHAGQHPRHAGAQRAGAHAGPLGSGACGRGAHLGVRQHRAAVRPQGVRAGCR